VRVRRTIGLPVTCLRLFTVYGPRLRPDMLIHRLLTAVDLGIPFELFGDGSQQRDLTFVDDVVDAFVATAEAELTPGSGLNIGAGAPVRVADVVAAVEDITGAAVPLVRRHPARGDVTRTHADTARARTLLGWAPATPLRAGIKAQADWQLVSRPRSHETRAG